MFLGGVSLAHESAAPVGWDAFLPHPRRLSCKTKYQIIFPSQIYTCLSFLEFIWSKTDPAFFQIIQNIWEQGCVSHKLTRTKALQWLSQTHMIFWNLTDLLGEQILVAHQPALQWLHNTDSCEESYSTYLFFMLVCVTPFQRAETGEPHCVPKHSHCDTRSSGSWKANICSRPTSNSLVHMNKLSKFADIRVF